MPHTITMPVLLKNLGLEESESLVYEALLELGPATVSEVTSKAGITRTLGYHVLNKLALLGLVDRASGSGSKIKYSANHPRSLLQYVKNKKGQWDKREKEVEQLLPELISLYKIAEKPIVRYAPGTEGVKNACSEAMESTTEILSVEDIDLWDTSELSNFGKLWDKERSRLKIPERQLILDTPKARDWMKGYQGSYSITNYRWIKKEQLPGITQLSGNLNIFNNKVVITLLKKPNQMGIVIESVALVSVMRTLFELAWQMAVPAKRRTKKYI